MPAPIWPAPATSSFLTLTCSSFIDTARGRARPTVLSPCIVRRALLAYVPSVPGRYSITSIHVPMADTNATVASPMECKFLDSYEAEMGGATLRIWHCRKRDPFVLGDRKDVALATCASCRLGDFTRPPAELAAEIERP